MVVDIPVGKDRIFESFGAGVDCCSCVKDEELMGCCVGGGGEQSDFDGRWA